MPTIKITGVDDEIVAFVNQRSKSLHFNGQAEYLRSLIREDMARATAQRVDRLNAIVSPLHAHSDEQGYSVDELAQVFEFARVAVAERHFD